MKESIIDLARRIATQAHYGQHRRDGATPYIKHPAAVAEKLSGESDDVVAAAWLHDVLEDTETKVEDLETAGIPSAIIEAVQVLTKQRDIGYGEYLRRVKQNEIARKVKIADMLHNLSDAPTEKQVVKYARGLLTLV